MIQWMKKIFGVSRYSLAITNLIIKNNELFCSISDAASINPYEDINASKIFSNDRIMSQIKPRELLKLKEIHDRLKQDYVVVTETYANNKYKVLYYEHEFVMNGKDICKDNNLLKSMKIEDAFRIIYNTAYADATEHIAKLTKLEKKLCVDEKTVSDNVVSLRKE